MFVMVEFRGGIQPTHALVKTERCNSLEFSEFSFMRVRDRSTLSFTNLDIYELKLELERRIFDRMHFRAEFQL